MNARLREDAQRVQMVEGLFLSMETERPPTVPSGSLISARVLSAVRCNQHLWLIPRVHKTLAQRTLHGLGERLRVGGSE